MKKLFFILICASLFSGCITDEVEIDATKSWEGHFYEEEQAQKAIDSMKLEKGESVWILSNRTLKRVLKNLKED